MLESWTELDQPSPQYPGKGTQPIWMTLVGDSQAHPSALLALHYTLCCLMLAHLGCSGGTQPLAAGPWRAGLSGGGPTLSWGPCSSGESPSPTPRCTLSLNGRSPQCSAPEPGHGVHEPCGCWLGGPHRHTSPRFQNHHGQPELLTALHSLRRALSLRQHRKDAMAARINATVTPRPPRLGSQPGLADTEDATNPTLNFRVPSLPHPEDFTRRWIKAALRGQEQTARKRTEAHGQHF